MTGSDFIGGDRERLYRWWLVTGSDFIGGDW